MTTEKTVVAEPVAMLEARIMDPTVPKNRAEHWAAREIEKLRAEIEKLRAERDYAWETIDRMCRDMNKGTFVNPEIWILLSCCVLAGVTWWVTR